MRMPLFPRSWPDPCTSGGHDHSRWTWQSPKHSLVVSRPGPQTAAPFSIRQFFALRQAAKFFPLKRTIASLGGVLSAEPGSTRGGCSQAIGGRYSICWAKRQPPPAPNRKAPIQEMARASERAISIAIGSLANATRLERWALSSMPNVNFFAGPTECQIAPLWARLILNRSAKPLPDSATGIVLDLHQRRAQKPSWLAYWSLPFSRLPLPSLDRDT